MSHCVGPETSIRLIYCYEEVQDELLFVELVQSANALEILDVFRSFVVLGRQFNWFYFVNWFEYWVDVYGSEHQIWTQTRSLWSDGERSKNLQLPLSHPELHVVAAERLPVWLLVILVCTYFSGVEEWIQIFCSVGPGLCVISLKEGAVRICGLCAQFVLRTGLVWD